MLENDVFSIADMALLHVSDSGEFFLVVSNRNEVQNVYKINKDNSSNWINITPFDDRIFNGTLSPDEKSFIFPKEQKGNEKHDLYITDIQTNNTSLFLSLQSTRVNTVKWAPDGKYIFFDGSTESAICIWRLEIESKKLDKIYETTSLGELSRINPKQPYLIWNEDSLTNPKESKFFIINYLTGKIIKEFQMGTNFKTYGLIWSTDGNKVIFYTDITENPTLGVLNINSGEHHYIKAEKLGLARDYTAVEWLPDQDKIIYAAKKNGVTRLYIEDLTSNDNPIEINVGLGYIKSIRIVKKHPEIIYVEWSNLTNPTLIIEYNLETKKKNILLESKQPDFKNNFGTVSYLEYESFDKRKIPAFLVEPSSNKKLLGNPIIILVHGGPAWEFSQDWNAMGNVIQNYANAGFKVFCPNIRGSTGYGKEFLELNLGDLGGNDLKDVLEGKKYLSKKFPDCKFQFITGASYGGFMTFLIMTKYPKEFSAGVAIVGITDWFEMHRLGDRVFKSFTETYFLGRPEEKKDLYSDRSAINFVQQLSSPLLIIHRENDSRCPVQPIYTFYDKAKQLGKNIELYVEKGAGHGSQKMSHLKKQYTMATNFFLQKIKH